MTTAEANPDLARLMEIHRELVDLARRNPQHVELVDAAKTLKGLIYGRTA